MLSEMDVGSQHEIAVASSRVPLTMRYSQEEAGVLRSELDPVLDHDMRRGTRRTIETWFVSKQRFRVSLRSRRVLITADTTVDSFGADCLQVWSDLGDGRVVTFHVVKPKPPGLPSNVAHVILIQGEFQGYRPALYYGTTLPVLQRLRAGLYSVGANIEEFLMSSSIQKLGLDMGRLWTVCCLCYQRDGMEIYNKDMRSWKHHMLQR